MAAGPAGGIGADRDVQILEIDRVVERRDTIRARNVRLLHCQDDFDEPITTHSPKAPLPLHVHVIASGTSGVHLAQHIVLFAHTSPSGAFDSTRQH